MTAPAPGSSSLPVALREAGRTPVDEVALYAETKPAAKEEKKV